MGNSAPKPTPVVRPPPPPPPHYAATAGTGGSGAAAAGGSGTSATPVNASRRSVPGPVVHRRPPHALDAYTLSTGLYKSCTWAESPVYVERVRGWILDRTLAPRLVGLDEDDVGVTGEGSDGKGALTECPVCFLLFAAYGLNRTACCKREMCTECYLHVQTPAASVECPFCQRPSFHVTYTDDPSPLLTSAAALHRRHADGTSAAGGGGGLVAAAPGVANPTVSVSGKASAAAPRATSGSGSGTPLELLSRGIVCASVADRDALRAEIVQQDAAAAFDRRMMDMALRRTKEEEARRRSRGGSGSGSPHMAGIAGGGSGGGRSPIHPFSAASPASMATAVGVVPSPLSLSGAGTPVSIASGGSGKPPTHSGPTASTATRSSMLAGSSDGARLALHQLLMELQGGGGEGGSGTVASSVSEGGDSDGLDEMEALAPGDMDAMEQAMLRQAMLESLTMYQATGGSGGDMGSTTAIPTRHAPPPPATAAATTTAAVGVPPTPPALPMAAVLAGSSGHSRVDGSGSSRRTSSSGGRLVDAAADDAEEAEMMRLALAMSLEGRGEGGTPRTSPAGDGWCTQDGKWWAAQPVAPRPHRLHVGGVHIPRLFTMASLAVRMMGSFIPARAAYAARWQSTASTVVGREFQTEFLTGEDEGTVVFTMNRPATKNALGRDMMNEFRAALDAVRFRPDVRAVVLRSAVPKVFCAGADLKERASMSKPEVAAFVHGLRTAFNSLATLPMPTIAAIEGAALGGGLEMALACDFRVAGGDAVLGLPETGLAIIPGAGGTQRLPRLIGASRAKELIFTARKLTCADALAYGLINYAVPAGQAVPRAMALAREMSPQGPVAIRMAKEAIDKGMEADLSTGMAVEQACYAQVIPTADRVEGLTAFREKRKPVYRGE